VIVIVVMIMRLEFMDMLIGCAKLAQTYVELYLDINPQWVANTSGMGWLLFVLKTLYECHTQLRMNIEIFTYLHDLLV
jgi:hypothetical protein